MPRAESNRLLRSLSSESCRRLLEPAILVELPRRSSLYEAQEAPAFAYFLTSGLASVVTVMENGDTAEVSIIGNEGLIGGTHILGPARPYTNAFVQLEATALRIPLAHLKSLFRSSEEIRDRILEFNQHQLITISQVSACNRLHEAEERLARWFLMSADRIQSDTLNFTQEFLAMMLGSRRTTITLIAGALQRAELIEYSRGRVKILNRENLEAAACDCYRISRNLVANLYTQSRPG